MGGPSDGVGRPPLRVRLLGGFGIDGIEERALGSRKARLLLKRLALAAGRPVPADELAAVVWADQQPKQPNDQLSVLVSRLRGVLGAERLVRSDGGYTLAADWWDVVELERRAAEIDERLRSGETASALAAAQAALALAAGALLPEEDGDWVDAFRPAAARLVARARLAAAEAAVAAGEWGAARASAQAVLDDDPYEEAALRLVMQADAAAGRPGAALAAYAVVRARLVEDLGADPAPATERLHTAIVMGEYPPPRSATASAATAPAPAEPVVGRDGELARLDALLDEAAARAAVIEAEAGMGKSALLAAWTARVAGAAFVVAGRCDHLGGDLPLQPIVDGLATHLDEIGRDAAAELLGDEADALDPLLGRAGTGLLTRATTVAAASDVDARRAVLFGALASVLRRAAGEHPLVLVIDDLHQAAPGTAEFLAFARRRIPGLVVVATRRPEPGPDLPDAERIRLGPLALADAVALVGAERAPALHARSGGHPLFLRALAAAEHDELPESIVAAVRSQLGRLGSAAVSVEAAAACGTDVDVALVAAATSKPVAAVLDDLEHAARAGILRPRGAALSFGHELVRAAVEALTSPARARELHRAALGELASRPQADPLALARHAGLGGDPRAAGEALVAAAGHAADRFEIDAAAGLLDQAIALADSAAARQARARLRLARLDIDGAAEDAQRALDLGAGVEGFELAGWASYYGRDYDTALRYADEGVARASDPDLRASCLALAGRIRHTRGDLAAAAERLEEGVAVAPPAMRGMLQVWHAALLVHRGETDAAADLARRGLLDPHLAHPFAAGHGWFSLTYALALQGNWAAALDALGRFEAMIARREDKRFPAMAANLRGWLLRSAGQLGAAADRHRWAIEMAPGPTFQEAHYAALLDLTECALAAGDPDGAAAQLDAASDVLTWSGSMCWRHRDRYRLLTARLDSLDSGDRPAAAADDARAVVASAAGRGDLRYERRARLLAAAIGARAGRPPGPDQLGVLVEGFAPVCGPEGWRDLAELAAATGSDPVWRAAEERAAAVVAAAARHGAFSHDTVAEAVRSQLDRYRP